jgi:2-polyprenyl-3-methyl-5-hydroxy-6-metoxy-1,4-benzoquinol methylase
MDIIRVLSIKKKDKYKWVKYYEIETYKYYDYIIKMDILPSNKNILEIGSGGGIFYSKYKDVLTKKNNNYTCIDIHKQSIEYAKKQSQYVDFYVKDILEFTKKDLKEFDVLLLVQSYIQIPDIDKIFKKYFKVNPNGRIIMVNTIFPVTLSNIIKNIKTRVLPAIANNDCVSGDAMNIYEIKKLEKYLNRKIKNTIISTSVIGFPQYLTEIY